MCIQEKGVEYFTPQKGKSTKIPRSKYYGKGSNNTINNNNDSEEEEAVNIPPPNSAPSFARNQTKKTDELMKEKNKLHSHIQKKDNNNNNNKSNIVSNNLVVLHTSIRDGKNNKDPKSSGNNHSYLPLSPSSASDIIKNLQEKILLLEDNISDLSIHFEGEIHKIKMQCEENERKRDQEIQDVINMKLNSLSTSFSNNSSLYVEVPNNNNNDDDAYAISPSSRGNLLLFSINFVPHHPFK